MVKGSFKQVFGLQPDEKEVLDHLGAAWEAFLKINKKHPRHTEEFCDGIHRLQYIIGTMVAQRVNPEIWYTPTESEMHDKEN